ncbi:uncharacterized protein G2W53_004617 [Senna tora]|uniref:Retrotransposon gag domain-containing protein n=1 Tax=Senna tora TaxID=362788 RepID=A0A834XC67_9FABA|nr:uncharacterized protein G2W53_004617 [Senna tora]
MLKASHSFPHLVEKALAIVDVAPPLMIKRSETLEAVNDVGYTLKACHPILCLAGWCKKKGAAGGVNGAAVDTTTGIGGAFLVGVGGEVLNLISHDYKVMRWVVPICFVGIGVKGIDLYWCKNRGGAEGANGATTRGDNGTTVGIGGVILIGVGVGLGVVLSMVVRVAASEVNDDGGNTTEGGAAEGLSGDRTTALLAALTARRAAQEKAREAGTGGTPKQGSVNLPPDPRDDVMITLLEQQKLLQEEIQEMLKKMGGKEGQGDNSKKQDTHKSGSRRSRSSKRRERNEELDRSSSESRSGESSSSSQSTDFTPPKKKRRYPFVDRIMEVAMPKLRTPTQLKHYDGASDPVAHVNSFKAAMLYAGAPDEVMCRAFPSTLDGDAQLWFSDLPSGSISSFRQLSKRFTSYFATSRTIKRTAHCLKNVVQGREESLKDFLIRFTKAARQIQGLKTEVALSYLTDNLRSKLFCCSITKKPPKTMAELLARSTKYIAFEEVQQTKEGGQSKKEEAKPSRSRSDGYRREDRKDDRRDDRSRRERRQKPPRSFGPRFSSVSKKELGIEETKGVMIVAIGVVIKGTERTTWTLWLGLYMS